MSTAEVRALSANKEVQRNAAKLLEELDNVTDVGFRPEIHDEDSAVHMIEEAAKASRAVASGGGRR